MNAPLDSRQLKGAAWCAEAADLVAIFDDAVQIAVLKRSADEAISDYFEAVIVSGQLGSGFRTALPVGQRPDLAALPGLPDLPGREALADDLATLTELYGDLLGCDTVGLRLEVVGRAMCPRFHVDHVGIRMLCTYRGPGTEWLDEDCADRAFLGARSGGQPDDVSGLIRDTVGIHAAPSFAIVLLKGDLWQGNAGRGIIHRSPMVAESQAPRVLVAIDAVWD
jgi:hypothetical protein